MKIFFLKKYLVCKQCWRVRVRTLVFFSHSINIIGSVLQLAIAISQFAFLPILKTLLWSSAKSCSNWKWKWTLDVVPVSKNKPGMHQLVTWLGKISQGIFCAAFIRANMTAEERTHICKFFFCPSIILRKYVTARREDHKYIAISFTKETSVLRPYSPSSQDQTLRCSY